MNWSARALEPRDSQRLFITEGTVKVHVHHVFDKLGVRSRTALAMNAARERWRQAHLRPARVTRATLTRAPRKLDLSASWARSQRASLCGTPLLLPRESLRRLRRLTYRTGSRPLEPVEVGRPGSASPLGRAVGGHRVVGIRDGDDPREEWNLVAWDLVWIPLAVDPLVMVADDESHICVQVDLLQDALADPECFLHLSALFERQWPVLQKQARRKADLPDVVYQAAEIRALLHVRADSPIRSAMSLE